MSYLNPSYTEHSPLLHTHHDGLTIIIDSSPRITSSTPSLSSSRFNNRATADHDISNFAGKVLTGVGLGGMGLFFTSPVLIPTAAAVLTIKTTFFVNACLSPPETNVSPEAFLVAVLSGTASFGITASCTMEPMLRFVYSPEIKQSAVVIGVALAVFGALLWAKSSYRRGESEGN